MPEASFDFLVICQSLELMEHCHQATRGLSAPWKDQCTWKVFLVTDVQASAWLQEMDRQRAEEARHEETAADQVLPAAGKAPRRHRARVQRGLYARPNLRKDAEESERTKWTEVLAAMLASHSHSSRCVVGRSARQHAALVRGTQSLNTAVKSESGEVVSGLAGSGPTAKDTRRCSTTTRDAFRQGSLIRAQKALKGARGSKGHDVLFVPVHQEGAPRHLSSRKTSKAGAEDVRRDAGSTLRRTRTCVLTTVCMRGGYSCSPGARCVSSTMAASSQLTCHTVQENQRRQGRRLARIASQGARRLTS